MIVGYNTSGQVNKTLILVKEKMKIPNFLETEPLLCSQVTLFFV